MKEDEVMIASEKRGDAATCGPSPGPGCSKSDSATPLTDALFAKCKARPTDGSGSRDGGWGAADIADFLRHSRKLEIALGMTAAALRDISGAKAADDVPLYAKSFELLGRIQGIASVALNSISTLNRRVSIVSESANERSAGPVGSAREVRECRSCAFWKRHSAESTVGLCRQALPRNEAWTTDAWDMCSDYTLNT